MRTDFLKSQDALLADLDQQFSNQPNVGFVLVTDELMKEPETEAFIKKHFELLANATTWYDSNDYHWQRLILKSDRFTRGWGQYTFTVERLRDWSIKLRSVDFVQ